MANIEIERRFFIDDKVRLLGLLEIRGEKSYEIHQIDKYYTPQHRNFVEEKYPFEWLRIRREDKISTLTYKHWYPERVKESKYCDEFETSIGSNKNLESILKALDFKHVVTVDKVRLAYNVENFEVAIDDIRDLGAFIEIEFKGVSASVDDAIKEIYSFAKELDLKELPEDHPVRTGYPLSLYRKLKIDDEK